MSAVYIPDSLLPIVPNKLEVKIGKIIHQTYKSLEQLPEHWKDTPAAWKHYHPNWTYMFWSDIDCRRLVQEKFPWFLKTYDGYEYNIQRADAIRPMILHTYSGIYADCDIQPTRPFDDLFYQDADIYLIRTPNTNCVTNCLMAGKSGIKFWIRLLEEMMNRANNSTVLWPGKHWAVMTSTGPMVLSDIFAQYEKDFSIKFLPQSLILPCNICIEKPCSTVLGYTKLLEGSSWVEFDSLVYNYLLCHWSKLLILYAAAFVLCSFYYYLKV